MLTNQWLLFADVAFSIAPVPSTREPEKSRFMRVFHQRLNPDRSLAGDLWCVAECSFPIQLCD